MKIRDRRMIAVAGWVGTRLFHALSATMRLDFVSLGPKPLDPASTSANSRFIYTLWHENFLIPITRFGNERIAALVSNHADGQLLGSLIRASRMQVIHGSTNRGGITAVRRLLRENGCSQHLAVTPDGPRGPRRRVQPGVVYLASRTGMQIVPMAMGHRNPWRLKSWDRLAVPRPFSRVRCIFGEPISVPPDLDSAALAASRDSVQKELDRLSLAAEAWADTGTLRLPAKIMQTRITLPVVQQPLTKVM